MNSRTPAFSAVIITFERHELLAGAIDSLLRQDFSGGFEILVIDNSRDQRAAAEFGKRYEGVETVRYILEPVVGAPNARNRSIALARGRIVGMIDDDARAHADWMRRIVAAFDAFGGRAGCVGGRIVPLWQVPRPAWLPDDLLGYLSIVDWGGTLREAEPHEWLAGCNLAFERDALIAAGGFSTALGRKGPELTLLSQEDLDAYRNVQKLGKLVVYAPEAVVEHIIGPSRLTQDWMRRRIAWQAVSEYIENPERMTELAVGIAEHVRTEPEPSGRTAADEFLLEHQTIRHLTIGLLSGRIGLHAGGRGTQPLAEWLRAFAGA